MCEVEASAVVAVMADEMTMRYRTNKVLVGKTMHQAAHVLGAEHTVTFAGNSVGPV